MTAGRDEGGYALVAAVASIVVFALIALAILTTTRGTIEAGAAEIEQARAGAAADAGVALAIARLVDARAVTQLIDGRPRPSEFDGARLMIAIEDERGKVPLNLLDGEMAERLLSAIGLSGQRLEIARDSLLDWIDADEDARPSGAETGYYARFGYRPRNGAIGALGELRRVRGFDAALIARMIPVATVNFGIGSFDEAYASPVALAVMRGEEASIDVIAREREQRGQRTAFEDEEDMDVLGRPLTIAVVAETPGGGRAQRRVVVELTGAPVRPYVIRSYD